MSIHQNERQGSAYSFIGEVSASSTHEINNELAVINEQSRLTAELLALGRLGHEVDPAELEHLVNRVIARVERADKLVQRMNAFAHSLEKEDGVCNLAECLELMTAMFRRKAGMKSVSLEIVGSGDVMVGLGALSCEQLLWRGFGACLDSVEAGTSLGVSVQTEGGEAKVAVKGVFQKPVDQAFLEAWKPFGVTAQALEREFVLELPGASRRMPETI